MIRYKYGINYRDKSYFGPFIFKKFNRNVWNKKSDKKNLKEKIWSIKVKLEFRFKTQVLNPSLGIKIEKDIIDK